MYSLESPHRGDSKEHTQYTNFKYKKNTTLNYPSFAAMEFFYNGLKNEFETAVVTEPSVFEPLKFYCMLPDRVSNPGSLALESDALPTELRGPAGIMYRLSRRPTKVSQVPEIYCL